MSMAPVEMSYERRTYLGLDFLEADSVPPARETRARVRFRGDEFFFEGHRLAGKPLLPGTVLQELMLAACQPINRPGLWGALAKVYHANFFSPAFAGEELEVRAKLLRELGGARRVSCEVVRGAELVANGEFLLLADRERIPGGSA
jgi:3-hydroxymyristoyl/3-hydroxydecanoyl-(acyl carrier protein) dehydratase